MSKATKTKLVGLAASFTAAPAMAADLPVAPAVTEALSPDERTIAITGGLIWSNSYEVNPVEGWRADGVPVDKLGFGGDKLGLLDESEIGGYGQIAVFNYNPAKEWDWHAAFSYTGLPKNSARRGFFDDDDDGFRVGAFSEFHYATLDFDIGKTNKLSPNNYSRLGFGLRGLYAHLEAGQSAEVFDKGISQGSKAKIGQAEYFGVGPYIRGDLSRPLNNGRVSVVGSADASLLLGSLERTARARGIDDDGVTFGGSFSDSEFSLGYTLGGSAGFGFDVTDSFNLVVGYRGEMLGIQEIEDLIFSHGPFITGKIKFGGQ